MAKKYLIKKEPFLGSLAHEELEMIVLEISDAKKDKKDRKDKTKPPQGKDEAATIADIKVQITNFLERAVRSVNDEQRVRISRAGRTC